MQKFPDLSKNRYERSSYLRCLPIPPRRWKLYGFTLIELLVTIALVGVLAVTATIINPVTQLQKARDSQRKSDLKLIQSVLEFHISDNGYYPASLPACNAALETAP